MKQARVGSSQWAYEERGSGPAIVLVHGFPLDHRIWLDQLSGLSPHYRVIAVDLKGFGQSPSTEAFTIDSMADELAEFIRGIGAGPCILVGLSMGGYVALALAARQPEMLEGLVIVCSRAEADTQAAREGRQKTAELAAREGAAPVAEQMLPKMLSPGTLQNRPEIVQRLRVIMEACPPTTLANASFAMRDRPDRSSLLPRLQMPVLVLLGAEDQLVPAAVGEKMADACQQGELRLIAGAGHLAPMESPDEFNLALRAFAERVNR